MAIKVKYPLSMYTIPNIAGHIAGKLQIPVVISSLCLASGAQAGGLLSLWYYNSYIGLTVFHILHEILQTIVNRLSSLHDFVNSDIQGFHELKTHPNVNDW